MSETTAHLTQKTDLEHLDLSWAPTADSNHWKAIQVSWDELRDWARKPASRKDCGGVVFGKLRGTVRRNAEVLYRVAIALDADKAYPTLPQRAEELRIMGLLHTTWSHAPDQHRWRLIFPTDRQMTPGEYEIAAESLAQLLGSEQFDRASFRPAQFMWKPSDPGKGWYQWKELKGEPVSVDWLIGQYDVDAAEQRFTGPDMRQRAKKRDPFSLPGVVGLFNRVYQDLDELIEAYSLPYVKEAEGRYRYEGASHVAGMGPVRDLPGVWYSHHASDEAFGQACTAFDLVRIHCFGDWDNAAKPNTPVNRRPSYHRAMEAVANDPRVKEEQFSEAQTVFTKANDLDPALDEVANNSDDWRLGLQISKSGMVLPTVDNWDLVRANDPVFKSLAWNEMLNAPVVLERPPWATADNFGPEHRLLDAYLIEIRLHLERAYKMRASTNEIADMVAASAWRNVINPLRSRLESLVWDGKPRLEECWPGVNHTEYTRKAARVCLVGAVARVFEPGCKVDNVPILAGKEGLGKTRFTYAMALEDRYCVAMGPINARDSLLSMHSGWIVVSDEVAVMRRTEMESLKAFITKTSDNFRLPYGRGDQSYERKFVIWGTTNDMHFLRRQDGNRRFVMIEVVRPAEEYKLEQAYVEQVWAEAIYLYHQGEPTYFTPEEEELAAKERERFTQEDHLIGEVQEYLEMDIPLSWNSLSARERMLWFQEERHGSPATDVRQNLTCVRAIYREVLGNPYGRIPEADIEAITAALNEAPGWELAGTQSVPPHGRQVAWRRIPRYTAEDLL